LGETSELRFLRIVLKRLFMKLRPIGLSCVKYKRLFRVILETISPPVFGKEDIMKVSFYYPGRVYSFLLHILIYYEGGL